MTVLIHSAPGNRLLAALSARSRHEFVASCDCVELEVANELREPGEPIRDAYFPLAYMLGVRRVGITEAATTPPARGLSNYRRGEIAILERAGRNQTAGGCYQQGNDIYDELLGSKRVTLGGDLTQKSRR